MKFIIWFVDFISTLAKKGRICNSICYLSKKFPNFYSCGFVIYQVATRMLAHSDQSTFLIQPVDMLTHVFYVTTNLKTNFTDACTNS